MPEAHHHIPPQPSVPQSAYSGRGCNTQVPPQFEKLLLRALCKCRRIRKFFCEPAKYRLHCLHSCLLQHDLRYPGIIGIVPVSPWKAALILPVPLCQWLYNVIQHSSSPVLFFCLIIISISKQYPQYTINPAKRQLYFFYLPYRI